MKHLYTHSRTIRTAAYTLGASSMALLMLAGCAATTSAPQSKTPSTVTTAPASLPASTLPGYHWQLTRATDAQGRTQSHWQLPAEATSGQSIQLDFSRDGMISVKNLCNQLNGRYTIDGSRMQVDQMVSTLRACSSQALMELERRVATKVPQLASWQVPSSADQAEPVLQLTFKDGTRWELQGEPTPATLYGSEGVREFLEVAPQRERCVGVAPMQCLKVRKVQYDSRGLKTQEGPWELFYSDIQGYRHEAGVRNVLRVQRYERRNVPADASKYVYVLDMVVESEIVKPR
ncbi:DUF4377 domain-containing protein [Comamonas sp. GB3 AK4-5]|uniref:DUF4377 domain-containing protein n=1 Tax=Comamonas sp. GB3 AK4-5 TaxID=3231487 RepID=UPI00351DD8DB